MAESTGEGHGFVPAGVLGAHGGDANGVAFSPAGLTLATRGEDGRGQLWVVTAGQEQRGLFACEAPIAALKFSLDGRHVLGVYGAGNGRLLIWDRSTAKGMGSVARSGGPSPAPRVEPSSR
jgi:WD40 repeat protein